MGKCFGVTILAAAFWIRWSCVTNDFEMTDDFERP